MNTVIRAAVAADFARLAEIGAEGDATGIDPHYLGFIARAGRLLVAADDRDVVAFGGMVPAGGVAMVTDMFVAAECRGHGVGGALLERLLAGHDHRMTFSSQHPAALPAYRRVGMQPRWRLLYLSGAATGAGTGLQRGTWRGDRPELVEHYSLGGAVVCEHAVVRVTEEYATVERLQHTDAPQVMAQVLAALPEGLVVRTCVPEPHPLAPWLLANGFAISDHDLFCASPRVEFPADVACVHAGLA